MANIAVQRIKREFKEVLKSEEVGPHVYIERFRFCFCPGCVDDWPLPQLSLSR